MLNLHGNALSIGGLIQTVLMRRRSFRTKTSQEHSLINRLSILLLCNLQRTKAIDSEINLESRRYESFSVTKQKETTRSHPEHGRKDFSRRQYSEGSLPGR